MTDVATLTLQVIKGTRELAQYEKQVAKTTFTTSSLMRANKDLNKTMSDVVKSFLAVPKAVSEFNRTVAEVSKSTMAVEKKKELTLIEQLYKDFSNKYNEYRENWREGALEAQANFSDTKVSFKEPAQDLFKKMFEAADESLTSFIKTGEHNFKAMVRSMLKEFARLEGALLASAALRSLAGAVGDFFRTPEELQKRKEDKARQEQKEAQQRTYAEIPAAGPTAISAVNNATISPPLEIGRAKETKEEGALRGQAKYETFSDQYSAYQTNFVKGANNALDDYIESAVNVADSTNAAFTTAFAAMDQALGDFVLTGKLNFKDFAKSLLKDLAVMELKMAASGILRMMFGAVGSLFSQAPVQSLVTQGLPASPQLGGLSGGGYTGDGGKYEAAGIVHRGEFVMTKEATSRIGVGNLYAMMRGYDGGGLVTDQAPLLGLAGGGALGNTFTTTVVVQQNGSQQTAGNSSDGVGKAYQQVIDKSVRDGIARETTPGGIIWNATQRR